MILKLLTPLSFTYSKVMELREFLYERGILKRVEVRPFVISVGNLSMGGSGKTTLVRYIAQTLKDFKVCIVSRGYKRKGRGLEIVSLWGEVLKPLELSGDEPYLLAKLLRGVSVIVCEDKAFALKFSQCLGCEVVLIDDGFQFLKVKKDLEVLLLRKRDLKERVFPAGLLREGLGAIRRASVLVLPYQELESERFEMDLKKPVFKMYRRDFRLLNYDLKEVSLKSKEVYAFSALGDNQQFKRTLERLGFKVLKFYSFYDHYHYKGFKPQRDKIYVTTLKDLFKVGRYENVLALDFKVEVPGFEEFLRERLLKC